MVKLHLTDEDKAGLIEAINKGVEPKPDDSAEFVNGIVRKGNVIYKESRT